LAAKLKDGIFRVVFDSVDVEKVGIVGIIRWVTIWRRLKFKPTTTTTTTTQQ
jgi:hypothetical protein